MNRIAIKANKGKALSPASGVRSQCLGYHWFSSQLGSRHQSFVA
ncbi:hypothetical protein [Nostoc mirabile]|nr:hypothetical protein [Nostoc mirabile]